jgi:molybdenum-dependent DNA-binding transcriptional regulator ModE
MEEHLTMSQRERTRLGVMQQVKAKTITLAAAAEVLGLCYRQAKRIWKRYRKQGDQGLVHRGRGRRGNRAKSARFKERVLARYQNRYEGFGPTLACEHLARDGLQVDHETLRRWLLKSGDWSVQRRRQKHRQWRERKPCFGQLVQMDGSEHDWFEGRGPRTVLMVMVDDATNRTHVRFSDGETTRAAYDVFEGYTRKYGLPQGLYVDRDSIYKTTRQPTIEEQLAQEQPLTQFGRAMKQLGVELDLAYSPQAKGRVERRNGLLQDRLVKELRLAKINEVARANLFLEETFLPDLNRRFCVEPAQPADVHRGVPRNLNEVLGWEEERVVQRDLTVSCQGRYFQIHQKHEALCLVGKKITVRELRDGTVQLLSAGQKLHGTELSERPKPKTKPKVPKACKTVPTVPASSHPWRNFVVGTGKQFWREEAARSRAPRPAAQGLRSVSASLRPPSVPGQPAPHSTRAQNKQQTTKGTFSPELTKGHF